LKKICFRLGKCLEGITDEALKLLLNYSWPGNVRELENVIERATILCTGNLITPRELPIDIVSQSEETANSTSEKSLAAMEKDYILKVLQETRWNKTQSARILGITKKTLYNKLRQYHLFG